MTPTLTATPTLTPTPTSTFTPTPTPTSTPTSTPDPRPPLISLAVFNDGLIRLGLPSTFSATVYSPVITTSAPITYTWLFGDGSKPVLFSTTDLLRPSVLSYTYPTAGVYTAVVTVSNGLKELTATTLVTVEAPITGLLAFNNGPTALGQLTRLWAVVGGTDYLTYTWNLGNGFEGQGAVISTTYLVPGDITAIVTASNGVSLLTATTIVLVREPITGFMVINDSPMLIGQPTNFTTTVITGFVGLYRWNFGDGAEISGAQANTWSHTYAVPGIYEVIVTATNQVSLVTATTVVTINALPVITADVAITKLAWPSPAVLHEPLTYILLITNNGPALVADAVLTDALPAEMVLSSTLANCQEVGGISCTLEPLPFGATATVTIVVTPTLVGLFTNTAEVMATPLDPITVNNVATVATTIGHAMTTLRPEVDSTLAYTNSQNNFTMLTIPSTVVTEPIVLLYTELADVDSIPDGFEFANRAFKLEFYQGGRLLSDYVMTTPLTVTLGNLGRWDIADLVLMIWDGAQWLDAASTCAVPLPSQFDHDANQLVATICYAPGQFALFSKPIQIPKVYLPIIMNHRPAATPTLTRTSNPQPLTPTPTPTQTPTPTPTPTPTSILSPDLVGMVSLVPDQQDFSANEAVLINVVVTNQGDAPTGAFWVDLFINPKTPPTNANFMWHEQCGLTPCYGLAWRVNGLQPGESVTLTSTADSYSMAHAIWPGYFASGTTDLYVYVDTWSPSHSVDGAITESNEANNRAEYHGLNVKGARQRGQELSWPQEFPERTLR